MKVLVLVIKRIKKEMKFGLGSVKENFRYK